MFWLTSETGLSYSSIQSHQQIELISSICVDALAFWPTPVWTKTQGVVNWMDSKGLKIKFIKDNIHQTSVLQVFFFTFHTSHLFGWWSLVTCDHVVDSVHLWSISFAWTETSPSRFCILLLILKTLLTSTFSSGSTRARWKNKNQNKDTHTLILVGNCVMTPICFLHFYDLSTPFAFKSGQTPITTQS